MFDQTAKGECSFPEGPLARLMLWLLKILPDSSDKLQKVNVHFPKGHSPAQCFDL